MWRKVEDDFAPVYCKLAKSKTGGNGYAWTMQRESETPSGNAGTGRLVEVAHDDDPVYDDQGNRLEIRRVMPDRTHQNRWSPEKSAR
jgi:hypothetical protein